MNGKPMLKETFQYFRLHPEGRIIYDWSRTMDFTEFRRWFMERLHCKINRNTPMVGRKYDYDYQREMLYASRLINTPRLIIDWLPADLAGRFSHRLRRNMEV